MNGKKSPQQRRSAEMEEFLTSIIEKIEEGGYPETIYKTQIERLLLHHSLIPQIKQELINGFAGISKVNEQTRRWMDG